MLKAVSLFALIAASSLSCFPQSAPIFDPATKVFRLDGGDVSYVFGVNARGELQQLYWGGKLAVSDRFSEAIPLPEWASFDDSYSNTPQEYAGWGSGLYMEPALKVTFADGNRDLVLHYDNYQVTPQASTWF